MVNIFFFQLEKNNILIPPTDRPITYLFNTLHFYEKMLRDRKSLKKKLVSLVIGSLDGVRPKYWALSEQYLQNTDMAWNPDLTYYTSLIKRLADSEYSFRFFLYILNKILFQQQ